MSREIDRKFIYDDDGDPIEPNHEVGDPCGVCDARRAAIEESDRATEFSVGDRALVLGVVTAGLGDGVNVELPSGEVVHLCVDDLRPDTGGRDLTAQDVLDALNESDVFQKGYTPVADHLNRIARGDAGAGDDTAPPAEAPCQGSCVGCGAGEDQVCTGDCACVVSGAHDRDGYTPDCEEYRAAASPRADDEPCVCHAGFTCTASEHDDTAPGVKCGVCDRPLALADPRYVHADGKTYRHPIRPVPAPSVPPQPTVPRVLLTDGWVTRVNAAQATVGEFLDNNPLAHDIGQEMRDALVVLSSDAHHRYAPTYSQMDENGEVDV